MQTRNKCHNRMCYRGINKSATMARIFISYRRADTAAMSRRIYDELVKRTGRPRVFRDVDTLMKGKDFRAGIERFILQSDVMLVLIGDQWLDIRDTETSERRLDNLDDFVRIEIDMGLRHIQTVIPVLVNGASMPGEEELPTRLSSLAFKNAVQISEKTFDEDFDILMKAIGYRDRMKWFVGMGLTVAALVLIAIVAIFALNDDSGGGSDTPTPTDDQATVVAQSMTEEPTELPTLSGFQVLQTAEAEGTRAVETQAAFDLTATEQLISNNNATVTAAQMAATETAAYATLLALIPTPTPTPITRNADWTPAEQEFGGVAMVLVPAGCFEMGENGEGGRQCFDQPFWIDKYEVTNAQYARFIEAGGYNDPTYWTEAGWQARQDGIWFQPRHWTDNRFNGEDQPVVGVSWYEALAYATWRGCRLPTEAEWEYAARGPDGLVYPWGHTFVADNLVYSANAGGHSADVGSRPGGVSWVGALDMSGNAWEWTLSEHRAYPYDRSDGRENISSVSRRSSRGGSWDSNNYSLRPALRSDNPNNRFSNIGFRLVCLAPLG